MHFLPWGSVKGSLDSTSALSQNKTQVFVLKLFVRHGWRDTKRSWSKTLLSSSGGVGKRVTGRP